MCTESRVIVQKHSAGNFWPCFSQARSDKNAGFSSPVSAAVSREGKGIYGHFFPSNFPHPTFPLPCCTETGVSLKKASRPRRRRRRRVLSQTCQSNMPRREYKRHNNNTPQLPRAGAYVCVCLRERGRPGPTQTGPRVSKAWRVWNREEGEEREEECAYPLKTNNAGIVAAAARV